MPLLKNRTILDYLFIKIRGARCRTILFVKSTVQTFVTLDTSTRYTNKSETILHTKLVIAFLNRSSGIKRGQPHNTYNIIITDTKLRQHLCFFVSLSELSGGYSYAFRRQPQNKWKIFILVPNLPGQRLPILTMKRHQLYRLTFMFNK